jgi:two-component system, OmpR family, KDP operon response regulator KdpE
MEGNRRMSNKTIVLIIEDDTPIQNFLAAAMNSQGYKTLTAANGETGVSLAASWNPDIILLDLGLPDMDGLKVISRIREISNTPIIIVSARHLDHEKVEALDNGADDYIAKPFSVPELLARIRVALRHQKDDEDNGLDGVYQNRELAIDYSRRLVTIRGETVHLTPIEYDIICLMAIHAGRVLTHKQILHEIRGSCQQESDSQTLRVFVSNLRRKIETNPADPEYIQTEVGVGYRLATGN